MDFPQKWIIIATIVLLSTSCAVIKDTPQAELIRLNSQNVTMLNGKYSNNPTYSEGTIYRELNGSRTYEPESFWSQIDGYEQGGSQHTWKEQTVGIEFVSDSKAIVSLYENGSLLKRKAIKGRIKDGYFYRRPYFFGVPFVPLFFGYKTYRYRFGLSDDKLILDYKWNLWAFAVLAGQSGKGQSHSRFIRVDSIK